mmetsp:Transcript_18459/g.42122  ORF Transcript_18459/g.42122 Transcript_18459/m.42122 type:complete len:144 (-) Transcript_18459:338-769(-)
MSVGFPNTHPSPSVKEDTVNLYVTSSSASKLEKERASQVSPPSFVSANEPREPTKYPCSGVSKSISYNVSENGSGTGFHILEEAASAGFAATPTIPVAEANAVAATVDPVFDTKLRLLSALGKDGDSSAFPSSMTFNLVDETS